MKKSLLLPTITMALIALFGCTEIPAKISHNLTNSKIILASSNGTVTRVFFITSTAPWTITLSDTTDKQAWITASPMKGDSGVHTITIKALENTTPLERSATVTLKSGKVKQNITVTQKINTNVHFEDKAFKACIVDKYDKDRDGEMSEQEALAITHLDIRNKDLESLKGIGYFTNLITLDCSSNNLTELDISNNTKLTDLKCGRNKFVMLDLSKNTELTAIDCTYSQLTSLDLSKNTKLVKLICHNGEILKLDISNNSELVELACSNNNLRVLDVTNNTKLVKLFCVFNAIEDLDVSNSPELTDFICADNPLEMVILNDSYNGSLYFDGNMHSSLFGSTTLTVIGANLQHLTVSNNVLQTLDVSGCPKLKSLECSGNKITELDLSNNPEITELECDDIPIKRAVIDTAAIQNAQVISFEDPKFKAYLVANYDKNGDGEISDSETSAITMLYIAELGLTSLKGIERLTSLLELSCSGNKLTAIDLTNNSMLGMLFCSNNNLTTLDVSKNAIGKLFCSNNQLSTLVLSKTKSLLQLDCTDNKLTTLDLSICTRLEELWCDDNQLITLDLMMCKNLSEFSCMDNPKLTVVTRKKGDDINSVSKDDHTNIVYID